MKRKNTTLLLDMATIAILALPGFAYVWGFGSFGEAVLSYLFFIAYFAEKEVRE